MTSQIKRRQFPSILKAGFLLQRPENMPFKVYKRQRAEQKKALKWYLTGKKARPRQFTQNQEF